MISKGPLVALDPWFDSTIDGNGVDASEMRRILYAALLSHVPRFCLPKQRDQEEDVNCTIRLQVLKILRYRAPY
jgi:hypothetical protein